MSDTPLSKKTGNASVNAFLQKVAGTHSVMAAKKRGRLLFAMDATASREPTWDHACQLQGELFSATAELGGLEVQLCYYRGFKEFYHTAWLTDTNNLLSEMSAVRCLGGHTQILRCLRYAIDETRRAKINALVFVGDCCEENLDELCNAAGQLGVLGVPLFVFHEGWDPHASHAFQQIAKLSQGAYCRFDHGSAQQLRDLLGAVAVYAAGGRKALEDFGKSRGGSILQLSHQLPKS